MKTSIVRQVQEYFGNDCQIAAAPGRVNLIGEHTDYNLGFVLPGAIDRYVYIGCRKNETKRLHMQATEYQEKFSFSLDDIRPVSGWPTYLLGMIYMIMPEQRLPVGLDVFISGDVPIGAGMSSSAALCSAFGIALNELFSLRLSKMDIALAGQKTEHMFASLQCGIMDQFASTHGKDHHLIKLDCRSLEYEYIPFKFPEHSLVLINTMVSHSLASSEYNLRRQQCEMGVSYLKNFDSSLQSLRDVSWSMLENHKMELDETVYKRCRFIISENQRLIDGCALLKKSDLAGFGQLMYNSHHGLSYDYEVSCKESDFLVDTVRGMEGVLGARQMGGGFGGCIICLTENDKIEQITTTVQDLYQEAYDKKPDTYNLNISEGARIILSQANV